MNDKPDIRPLSVETAIGRAGGFCAAPAGTPIPTGPGPIKGFEPIGYVVDEIDFAPNPLVAFAAEYDGEPYIWGARQNGKNTLTRALETHGTAEISISFDVTGFVAELWRALLFPKRRGLYTRTERHRRNKLRRKRAARRRQHR